MGAAGAALGLAAAGAWPALAPLPLLAALAKAWRGALEPPGRADFRALGYTEVAFSALFLGVSLVVF